MAKNEDIISELIGDITHRIVKLEQEINSDEFLEYRKYIIKTNGIIKGNAIPGIENYDFPILKGISKRQEYAATKYRESFVLSNKERFKELTGTFNYHDRFNWKLLHKMKVTQQEYVILFSRDAGDIYGRGINSCFDDNYEYIPDSCDKYEYEDD